jgi:hypothetical protein
LIIQGAVLEAGRAPYAAKLTSEVAAVLEVVNTLTNIALVKLLANKSGHHSADPLFADEGILGSLERLGIIVVDAVEGRSDGRLLGLELLGLGSRHYELN